MLLLLLFSDSEVEEATMRGCRISKFEKIEFVTRSEMLSNMRPDENRTALMVQLLMVMIFLVVSSVVVEEVLLFVAEDEEKEGSSEKIKSSVLIESKLDCVLDEKSAGK